MASSPSSPPRSKGPTYLVIPGSPTPNTRSKSPTVPTVLPSSSPPSPAPRPAVVRAQSAVSGSSIAIPSTPFYTPQVSSVNVNNTKRLLLPTVRAVRPSGASPRSPTKASAKPGRGRAGSLSVNVSPDPQERVPSGASDWLPGGEKFEVVEEQLELEGFQIYAVEKWVVARKRPILVLTVYTGDPKHKITVTALSLLPSLSAADAQVAWDSAIRALRRDGARPKETDKGVLMVTSLANFRSDYTIVNVPSGNFLDVREQLYTNVNLLRMGCGGRSALTLEEPSDATKDRFIAMYHVTDKTPARSGALFNATVLELVKLIQASLAIFGMFDLAPEKDGLLCDVTCEGIQQWVSVIGEPYLKVEPTEKVADPTVVAALFSLILSTRSKLHALGLVVPKDPFLDPSGFLRGLATLHTSKAHPHSHGHHPQSHASSPISPPTSAAAFPPSIAQPPAFSPNLSAVFLTQPLIELIQSQYEKVRQSESYKVHRVLKNKLDDLATDLRTHASDGGGTNASTLSVTADLSAFVRCVVSTKDAPQSLRYLWTGRPGHAEKKRREKEAVWSDGEREREDREKERDGERDAVRESKDKEERDKERDREPRSGDEGDFAKPWSGRMQRKIESWAALGKSKKLSVDFGTLGKAFMPDSPRGLSERSGQSSMVPSVIISRDPGEEEEVLSSGQQSPVSDAPNPLMLGVGTLPHAERSASELSEYDRRVTEFNQKRPSVKTQSRITSWSDSRSARGVLHDQSAREHRLGASPLSRADSTASSIVEDESMNLTDAADLDKMRRRRLLTTGADRRRSFGDAADLVDSHILPIERMRIDVELCGQLLVMRRREAHLANVLACLAALASRLDAQNAALRADHESVRGALAGLDTRGGELPLLQALRTEAEALTQETNALAYESAQFLVEDLWHMAAQPRQRALALREKIFGTGRRLPQGVRGAHGPFSRIQWTVDGKERLVDRLGRTESEAEEEEDLPPLPGMDLAAEEEVDAIEHQNLKPTWLLRFFNYWGSRLGMGRGSPSVPNGALDGPATLEQTEKADTEGETDELPTPLSAASSSVGLPRDDSRSQMLQRTITT
ncbi:uncharacterized protein TRAVEDRAFT_70176 [Trametes versicolor FP-101664 SS1]|uniref:uncharacterized protein n=1 Tax=Trametes versicolor (strain FP-101664) TaxID=717944 RepID=UPI0004622C36|nr:uncharacterized protein TRAVEDRAFT_70176 [Trametes versicolor FP-101664 SS1]EIW61941.1 hypothetical protein TRAVEDRAFT_70176 [Trametes versicolor FP-101664 SS1]